MTFFYEKMKIVFYENCSKTGRMFPGTGDVSAAAG